MTKGTKLGLGTLGVVTFLLLAVVFCTVARADGWFIAPIKGTFTNGQAVVTVSSSSGYKGISAIDVQSAGKTNMVIALSNVAGQAAIPLAGSVLTNNLSYTDGACSRFIQYTTNSTASIVITAGADNPDSASYIIYLKQN